jgi:TonB family protein
VCVLGTGAARADQLAWVSLEDGRRAVAEIEQSRTVVSYCSLCTAEAVEVWQVATATVSPTPTKGYYQVKVSGRRLYRSKSTFDEGGYREPIDYEPAEGDLWDEGVDLAYVYVRSGATGFTSLCRRLRLDCDIRTEHIKLPRLAPLRAVPDSMPDAVQAVRVGGAIKEPRKIKDVRPAYPDIAKQARVQGVVILECIVGADGRVVEVKVLRGIPLLDAAALEAVSQWRYEPTYVDGKAVPVIMTVTVSFRLD